jgi:hypothetical protein
MNLRGIAYGGMDWIDLVQVRDQWKAFANTVVNLWIPQNVGNFFRSCITSGLSGRAQLHRVSGFNPMPVYVILVPSHFV